MKIDQNYVDFIQSIRRHIVQSRYDAARLANPEQLLLYFNTGKMISDKIKAQKWGAKVMDQISADMQKELPCLKGFSDGKLKKVRIYAKAYSPHLKIGSTPSNQFGQADSDDTFSFGSLLSNQIENKDFFGISFSPILQFSQRLKAGKPGYSTSNPLQLVSCLCQCGNTILKVNFLARKISFLIIFIIQSMNH